MVTDRSGHHFGRGVLSNLFHDITFFKFNEILSFSHDHKRPQQLIAWHGLISDLVLKVMECFETRIKVLSYDCMYTIKFTSFHKIWIDEIMESYANSVARSIYIGWEESGFNWWGQGARARVIHDFVNVCEMLPLSLMSSHPLQIPATWVFLLIEWSIPLVQLWVTVSLFLVGNKEAELKLATFFSHLLFCLFFSFLFSWPLSDIVPLSAAFWG